MASHGQRFELDLNSPDWKFDIQEHKPASKPQDVIQEIRERTSSAIPAAPTVKSTKTGFPEHRQRRPASAFKQQRQHQSNQVAQSASQHPGPSDQAILHHAAKTQGIDLSSTRDKAEIDAENRNKINQMSLEEIEDARAELMAQISPDKLRRWLQTANVDDEDEKQQKEWEAHEDSHTRDMSEKSVAFVESLEDPKSQLSSNTQLAQPQPSSTTPFVHSHEHPPSNVHFPNPPRNKADYRPLDPSSATFLTDLKENYFPDLPHDPSSLSWLRDPTPTEDASSSYNPTRTGFAPSSIRFHFDGTLISPSQSLDIPTTQGLHHHGDAPSSAGYTVPELTLLARSSLPNQRCVAYQTVGRIIYRLGRGDFGSRGGELNEGLWKCIEQERVLEVIMAEANKDKGHTSAKTYATEALWLWRRGGGGDRGVLKVGEVRAK